MYDKCNILIFFPKMVLRNQSPDMKLVFTLAIHLFTVPFILLVFKNTLTIRYKQAILRRSFGISIFFSHSGICNCNDLKTFWHLFIFLLLDFKSVAPVDLGVVAIHAPYGCTQLFYLAFE